MPKISRIQGMCLAGQIKKYGTFGFLASINCVEITEDKQKHLYKGSE